MKYLRGGEVISTASPLNSDPNVKQEKSNLIKAQSTGEDNPEKSLIIKTGKETATTDSPTVVVAPSIWGSINFTLLAGLVTATFLKYAIQPFVEKAKLKLTYSMSEENKIESLLSQMLGITNADRVLLFEFHNGSVSKGGRHINKISATREVLGAGISNITFHYQSVLVGVMGSSITKMQTEGIVFTEVKELKEGICKRLFINHGIQYAISRMLVVDGIPIAIIQIQYCRNHKESFDKFKEGGLAPIDNLLSQLDIICSKEKIGFISNLIQTFSFR